MHQRLVKIHPEAAVQFPPVGTRHLGGAENARGQQQAKKPRDHEKASRVSARSPDLASASPMPLLDLIEEEELIHKVIGSDARRSYFLGSGCSRKNAHI